MATASVTTPPVLADDIRVVLPHVSWESYERLLADDWDRNVPRLTYDRGVLEIVSPSPEHDEDADTLRLVVAIVAAALAVPIKRLGSTTYRRPDLERGFEPDGSFYIQHEARMRGRRTLDLVTDPPPDLIIEMDVSRSSIAKLALFAAMGIPEVWRGDGGRVTILALAGDGYREVAASRALPSLTGDILTRFLAESRTLDSTAWFDMVGGWARAQRA